MKLYLKAWFWAAILGAFCLICLVIYLMPRETGDAVGIYQDGELLYTFTVEELSETHRIIIKYGDGTNIIATGGGTIWVSEATCADSDCVRHGPLEPGGAPIICLPNRLVIRWTDQERNGQVDAVSGGIG